MQDYNMGHVTHFYGRTGLSGVPDYGQNPDSISAEPYFPTTLNEDFAQISNLFEEDGNVELFMPSNITTLIHDYDGKGIFDELDFAAFDATPDYDNWKEPFTSKDICSTSSNQIDCSTTNKDDITSPVSSSKVEEDNLLLFEVGEQSKPVTESKSCEKLKLTENLNSRNGTEIYSFSSNLCETNHNVSVSESVSDFSDNVSLSPLPKFEKSNEADSSLIKYVPSKISRVETTVFAPTIADKVKRGRKRQSGVDCYHEIGMIIQQHEKRKRRKRRTIDLLKTHEHISENEGNLDFSSCVDQPNNLNKEENLEHIEAFLGQSESLSTTNNSCRNSQDKINSYVILEELPYKNVCAKVENFDSLKNDFPPLLYKNDSIECSVNAQTVKNFGICNSLPVSKGVTVHAVSVDINENCIAGNVIKIPSEQNGKRVCKKADSSAASSSLYRGNESKVIEPLEISTPELEIKCQSRTFPEMACLTADLEGPNTYTTSGSSIPSFIRGHKSIFEKDISTDASPKTKVLHSRHTSTSSMDSTSSYCHSTQDLYDSASPSCSNSSLKAHRSRSNSRSSSCDKSKRFPTNSLDENLYTESDRVSMECTVRKSMESAVRRTHSKSRSRSPHRRKYDHRSLSQSKSSLNDHRECRKSRSRSRSRGRKYSPNERSPSCRKGRYYKDHCKAIEERRIIYVGNIPEGYTVEQLKSRFHCFGPIIDAQIKSKNENNCREKSIFGFITFKNRSDAYNAFERGNKEPLWPKFDINFGGRRRFCNGDYTDLDGKVAERENIWYSSHSSSTHEQSEGDDFAALLKAEEMRLGIKRRQIHTK